ncbi:unnamed protein product [Urochloa decumbens]|uniref:Uncharacterized protein n=1 Tax=Urochloa decumbens TaxID=240449 RepID=A0ABC9BSG2_9POAL
MPMEFVQVKTSARGFGGFADLLLETLERAGVDTSQVTFMGVTQRTPPGTGRRGWTHIHTDIPKDPRVPELVPIREIAVEMNMADAVQTTARRTLREVLARLQTKLQDMPYGHLPKALLGPNYQGEALRNLREIHNEPDEKLRVAQHYLHAQDQALHTCDTSVESLHDGWNEEVVKVEDLEQQLQTLQAQVIASNYKNATLTARNTLLEAEVHNKEQALLNKESLLQDKDVLADELSDKVMEGVEEIQKHKKRLKWNEKNLSFFGAQLYYHQDKANRIATAWRRSDRKRVLEIKEAGEGQPAILRKKPRVESFELPWSQCPFSAAIPEILIPTHEMVRTAERLSDLLQ